MNNDCIFCKFVSKNIPTASIYEDDIVYAFLDIEPLNIGHTLVISKEHYRNIYDVPEEILGHMNTVAKKIAIKQKELLGAEGINIHMNNEKPAGQSVFHAHIHVMPRYEGDGFADWVRPKHTLDEVFAVADKLKITV